MAGSPWVRSWRADPEVAALADRHYNRRKVGHPQFVPPGRCLVLKTLARNPETGLPFAAWVTSWPFAEHVQHAWGGAWVNSLFRREGGPGLASDLICWAVAHTRAEWDAPASGVVSFIDSRKISAKPGRYRNAGVGWCYLKAGWRHVGYTAGGLHAFQQLPIWGMPGPARIPGDPEPLFDLPPIPAPAPAPAPTAA